MTLLEDVGPDWVRIVSSANKTYGYYRKRDNLFFKSVNKEKHLFRKTDSFGIDDNLFVKGLVPWGCQTLVIYESKDQVFYHITMSSLVRHTVFMEFQGFGKQRFIGRQYFEVYATNVANIPDNIVTNSAHHQ